MGRLTASSPLDEKPQTITRYCPKQAERDKVRQRYITTTRNRADLATRGVSTEEFINNQLRWHGTPLLIDNATKWPSWDLQQIDENTLEHITKAVRPRIMYETSALIEMEIKQERTLCQASCTFELNERLNYSSLARFLRVKAWALRVIRKLQ